MLPEDKYYGTTVLLVFLQLSSSAMVLPRPPSSPNHIRQDEDANDRIVYEGKSLQGVLQNTNVERPDTDDYRLLEIELQSPDDMNAANLQNLVHAMLKQSERVQNESYPNPEVIPHSILGVRDIGLTPNFRLSAFDEEKRVLLSPPKLQSLDDKLYYLKNGRPKVYVNVRGHSGSFRKESTSKTTSANAPVGFLRVTQPFQRQTDWKAERDKKIRPPKKFDRRIDGADSNRGDQKNFLRSLEAGRVNAQASAYGFDDLSTTENSMVTSSELPKQIPAPPSKLPSRSLMAQTTPVQRYALRRTDILPGYSFTEA